MCDCQEKKLFNNKSKVTIQGQDTICQSCSQNNSSIRDINDKKIIVKSLIHWNPCDKKITTPSINCNDITIDNKSQLSINRSINRSSIKHQFVDKCNSNEGEYQNDNDSNNNNDDIDISKNQWKIIPKNHEEISKIDKKNKSDIEYTVALINPKTMKYRMLIEQIIIDEGFQICQNKIFHLTPEQSSEFFIDKYDEIYFLHLITYMSSGPIVALVLAKYQAIDEWKKLIGPEDIKKAKLYYPDSMRAKYSNNDEEYDNVIHGSCTLSAAKREIHFFFPNFIVEPILTGNGAENYLLEKINPILNNGIALCCKTKPDDPLIWLANWLLKNNPNNPHII